MAEPIEGPFYPGSLTTSSAYPNGVTDAWSMQAKAAVSRSFGIPTILLANFQGLIGLSGPYSYPIVQGTPLPPDAVYTGIDTINNQPNISMPFPWEKANGQFGQ